MQKVHEEHYYEINVISQWCNVFLINKILIILDESANFLQRAADKSGSESANVGAPVIIIKYCFHVQTAKRSRKEGAGFLYSRCLSLDQNSPAPRTRAASQPSGKNTHSTANNEAENTMRRRSSAARQHPLIAFLSSNRCCAGLCFKHSD